MSKLLADLGSGESYFEDGSSCSGLIGRKG